MPRTREPSTDTESWRTWMRSATLCTISLFTVTRPSAISCSHRLRLPTPASARAFPSFGAWLLLPLFFPLALASALQFVPPPTHPRTAEAPRNAIRAAIVPDRAIMQLTCLLQLSAAVSPGSSAPGIGWPESGALASRVGNSRGPIARKGLPPPSASSPL